jgi:hypothetical protein
MGQKKVGKGQRYELKGRVFGRLTVLRAATRKSFRNWQWVCKCECGKETIVSATLLVRGKTKSCGCFRRDVISNLRRCLRPYESSYKLLISDNNKRKKHKVDLTFEEFLEFTKINVCHYCGDKIEWHQYRHNLKRNQGYNLDRVDPTKGYTKENCVVCCSKCNWMKWKLTYDDFIEQVTKISKNTGRR